MHSRRYGRSLVAWWFVLHDEKHTAVCKFVRTCTHVFASEGYLYPPRSLLSLTPLSARFSLGSAVPIEDLSCRIYYVIVSGGTVGLS